MMRISLGKADRERLGAPEVLEYDLDAVTVAEHRALKAHAGMTLNAFTAALQDEDTNFDALIALVWLALRRAGVEVPFGDLDFTVAALQFEDPETPEPPPPNRAARRAAGPTNSKP